MPKSIGIDLGTTNSVAAIKRVYLEVLKNAEGEYITPSCVSLQKGKNWFRGPSFIVGRSALEWLKQTPETTVLAVKRLIGRSFQNEVLQQILHEKKFHYRIERHSKGTERSVAIVLEGKEFTPEEISAEILKKIKGDAEKVLDDTVEFAVITVPAYFNDKQKHATRTAAALAGLKVRRLLSEPTAAAISFGVDNIHGEDVKTILVYDFGGGTFDLSVLTISGGQYIEQAKGGDMWLGGEDIDRLIIDYVLAETGAEFEIEDMASFIDSQEVKIRNKVRGELKVKAEAAKMKLTTDESAYIEILSLLKDEEGNIIDIDVELTRETLETLISPIIERTIFLTRKILDDLHLPLDLIDNVLMVGGSSLIPSLIAAMQREFGPEKVLLHKQPIHAIAEGAAILSHRLSDSLECPQCGKIVEQSEPLCPSCQFDLVAYNVDHGVVDIVHAAAHDYYIYLENGERQLLIEKNTPLPCQNKSTFRLVDKYQQLVHLKFFNIVNEKEESIGDLWLGIKYSTEEDKKDEEPDRIEIVLAIDENNIVEVQAQILEKPEVSLSRTLSRGKSDEKLFLELENVINTVNEGEKSGFVVEDVQYRSLMIIEDIHEMIDEKTGQINEEIYTRAESNIKKTMTLAQEGISSFAVQAYTRLVLKHYDDIIPARLKTEIKKKMESLRKIDRLGTVKEISKALDDLHESLDSLGIINNIAQLQKAELIIKDVEPKLAENFHRIREDIIRNIKNGNMAKAEELYENVLPQITAINESLQYATSHIKTDIRR